jgi:RNA polymerase sigma-54 factor
MRLEPTPRPDHVLRVSARLITSSTILHLSSDELERTVMQEQMENPTLDVREQRICLLCGTPMYGSTCPACGHFAQQLLEPPAESSPLVYESLTEPLGSYQQQSLFDSDNSGFSDFDSEDEFDLLAHIPTEATLEETLLQQLEALVTPDDAPIAEQLVGNLDEHGYLEISIEDIAAHLHVPSTRVAYVLSQLHTLEPLGIGARDARECLLIQLQALSEQETPHPLAHALIDSYLIPFSRNQFAYIARRLHVSEQEVRQAALYIQRTLHPFPSLIYRNSTHDPRLSNATSYIRPDVIIRKGTNGLEVELMEEKRYIFQIASQPGLSTPGQEYKEIQRYFHHQSEHARFFVDCIQRRWQTLRRVTELVINYQREFLDKGAQRYLRPLTRAEVASRLSLDEGTVSRATANKYALLPNGRLIPFSFFFDGSLGIKDVLREIIQSEESNHRYSDQELAHMLSARGIPMARRTITKYREEMGIGSSRERN